MRTADADSGALRVGLLFYAAMAGVAWAWRSLWLGESLWHPSAESLASPALDWLSAAALGAAFGGGVVWLSKWISEASEWGRAMTQELAEALGPLRLRDALLLALASGFAEELLFRGALQPSVGLLLASLLFALAHFTPRRILLPWVVFTGVVGLGLGVLFDATGQLAAPIAAHCVVNGINLPRLTRHLRLSEAPADGRCSRSRSQPPAAAPTPGPLPAPEPDRRKNAPRRER